MTHRKLEQLFELARELYAEEAKKREPMLTPYCWVENKATGEFFMFSVWRKSSKDIKTLLKNHRWLHNEIAKSTS